MTAASGTARAVDVSRDRAARRTWLLLLGGPLAWFAHFTVLYLVAEAGCTGTGPGLSRLDPPVPRQVIVVATVLALLCCVVCAHWARSTRDRLATDATPSQERRPGGPEAAEGAGGDGGDGTGRHGAHATGFETWATWDPTALLAQVGLLLCGLSALAILFSGLSTPWLPGCR